MPISLCDNTMFILLTIYLDRGNDGITCAPSCLTTIFSASLPNKVVETCPSFQDAGICGFIAATDIESISSKTMWSCNTDGVTITNPCNSSSLWSGVSCGSSGYIDSISLSSLGISGTMV